MNEIINRTALVTGGSRGIGRAISISLAKEGIRIVINYANNEAEAKITAKGIKELGGAEPLLIQFDVSKSDEVENAIEKIQKKFGSIDILINNAGVSKNGLLIRCKDTDWRNVLGINLDGAFFCARACSRLMLKKKWGRIINISSVVGEMGSVGQVPYVVAKAGLIGMTKSMAKEFASRQITVNAITPGYIETDMTACLDRKRQHEIVKQIPLGSKGNTQDIANAAVFLSSEKARYITGHVLAVNGGMYM
jgi:3-oxoacyl-[acyl-carrier protein] reductase